MYKLLFLQGVGGDSMIVKRTDYCWGEAVCLFK